MLPIGERAVQREHLDALESLDARLALRDLPFPGEEDEHAPLRLRKRPADAFRDAVGQAPRGRHHRSTQVAHGDRVDTALRLEPFGFQEAGQPLPVEGGGHDDLASIGA